MEKVQWNYTAIKQQLLNDGPQVTLSQSNFSASIHSNRPEWSMQTASELAGQAPHKHKIQAVAHLYQNAFYTKMVTGDVI